MQYVIFLNLISYREGTICVKILTSNGASLAVFKETKTYVSVYIYDLCEVRNVA